MPDTPDRAVPDWSAILDELKVKESLSSDSKLAVALGVTRGYICSVRKGRKNVSLELAKQILLRLGRAFEIERIEKLFVPQKVRAHTRRVRAVRDQVILRARGHCQLCGVRAPFNSPDGRPYLEIHPVTPYQEGGDDSPANLVALCPNCHRKLEISPSPSDLEKLRRLSKKFEG